MNNENENDINGPPICPHIESEVRYKVYSNGTKHYFNQCVSCGVSISSAIPHANIKDIDNIPKWDEDLASMINANRLALFEKMRDDRHERWLARQSEWDIEYNQYMKSIQWGIKRKRVLKRDNFMCQSCLRQPATEVHHLSYKFPLGKEPLFELVSVCKVCHGDITSTTGRG